MKAQAICGKTFEVEEENPTVEDICFRCPEATCETYVQYLYAATHYNNPR